MSSIDLQLEDLGLSETTSSMLPVEQARRLAATLDEDIGIVGGSQIPLLWHWAFFTPEVHTADLGADGHPRLGFRGPIEAFQRRMWAGGRLRSTRPLVVGQEATRRSSIARVERKEGRSGPLLFVTLRHEVVQGGSLAVEEEQDLVYRENGAAISTGDGDHQPPVSPGGFRETVTVEAVQIFRFSAVTFNSHRIHYDLPYANHVEGYPRLVVQGPLTALLIAQRAQRHLGRQLIGFDFRSRAPLFEGVSFTIVGEPSSTSEALELAAIRGDGSVAMTAMATTTMPAGSEVEEN